MEYYDLKEMKNITASDDIDQIIIVTVSSLSGIFGFILFCCCCTAGFAGWIDNCINNSLASNGDAEYGQRALRRMEEEEERKKEDPEVRKEKLLKSFDRNKVSMVVTEHSFIQKPDVSKEDDEEALTDSTSTDSTSLSEHSVDDNDSTHHQMDDENDDDEQIVKAVINNVTEVVEDIESGEPKELYLPPSKLKNGEITSRKVPNCCAVCLCSYDVGDTIIWSSNDNCKHAFHEECIVPWLTKNQLGECPCCRLEFTDLPPPDGKNNGSPSFWSIRSWWNRIRYTFVGQEEE